ncbi:uncharacterized protein VTP21DRAFT_2315 [Calcarisporiella thermophila]|uniref:uncharacterized protein n=1 Tax=Calcarisporiella thermophila TaxID=911321 RepID=UPI003742C516
MNPRFDIVLPQHNSLFRQSRAQLQKTVRRSLRVRPMFYPTGRPAQQLVLYERPTMWGAAGYDNDSWDKTAGFNLGAAPRKGGFYASSTLSFFLFANSNYEPLHRARHPLLLVPSFSIVSNALHTMNGVTPPPLEWRYEMRREMQEILSGLYLGPYTASRNLPLLTQAGITHILCVRDEQEHQLLRPLHPQHFSYLELELSRHRNMIPVFTTAKQFIDAALHSGGKVLVYCASGISSAPTFVIAYIMETLGLGYEEAFEMVQARRFCMNPCENFKSQLKEYEPILTARAQMQQDVDENKMLRGMRRPLAETGSEENAGSVGGEDWSRRRRRLSNEAM